MTKMFDYISGKSEGREALLEAQLEYVIAHCVPGGLLDEASDLLKRWLAGGDPNLAHDSCGFLERIDGQSTEGK